MCGEVLMLCNWIKKGENKHESWAILKPGTYLNVV